MQRLYSMFPRGGPGAGLVALRLSLVASLYGLTPALPHWSLIALLAGEALALFAGAFTPAVAVLCIASMLLLTAVDAGQPFAQLLPLLLQSIALLLLGPGAYALDARWYARRIVDVAPGE